MKKDIVAWAAARGARKTEMTEKVREVGGPAGLKQMDAEQLKEDFGAFAL